MTIGVFDSGVGGLSVLRHIQSLLPGERLLYFADQAHVPYGPRPAQEIRLFCEQITRFLTDQGASLIVVACNTATAASIDHLRHEFPQLSFVGMEPAVKPGASQTKNGKIGVLATAGTFESQRYASLLARFAGNITAYESDCPGLVEQIEAGELTGKMTEAILQQAIRPMLAAGVDTLILGCTHYPFALPLIEQIAGPDVVIIDPAPAVAQQVKRLYEPLKPESLQFETAAEVHLFTTGDVGQFGRQAQRLLQLSESTYEVLQAARVW
ncbi:MAG: glutamate racemase [Candidatus Promineifilaceae bacterium]